ncbi:hypothetical protein [Absidia glauca]|uniref:Ndc10 domain-containing protein n=1 Tax=Absidia glauca TaxID=4829 RepID=A0A163MI31_ABSGL|nr:hypothetical protein [Absidia glauca]
MNGEYLTSTPREMMRPMAGFLTDGRSFYNARAVLDRSTSLCKKLFPAIDERHDRLAAKKKLSPEYNNFIQPTVAANALVQMIMMLRKTFMQDSMPKIKLRRCHPIWQLSIFSDPAYLPFKRKSCVRDLL